MYSTHLAWPEHTEKNNWFLSHTSLLAVASAERCFVTLPLMVRLKQPSLSPDRESAPHCRTTALGWYISITLAMIYTKKHLVSQMLLSIKGNLNQQNISSLFTHRFENGFIWLIINPIPQRVIDSVIFTLPSTDVLQRTRQMLTHCVIMIIWLFIFLIVSSLPSGRLCQGSTLHTCGRTLSWHGLWCRKPPRHRLHDGCQYLCTGLSGGIWKEGKYPCLWEIHLGSILKLYIYHSFWKHTEQLDPKLIVSFQKRHLMMGLLYSLQ